VNQVSQFSKDKRMEKKEQELIKKRNPKNKLENNLDKIIANEKVIKNENKDQSNHHQSALQVH
jgi:hypothetical protein